MQSLIHMNLRIRFWVWDRGLCFYGLALGFGGYLCKKPRELFFIFFSGIEPLGRSFDNFQGLRGTLGLLNVGASFGGRRRGCSFERHAC